jgi:hypothetical protein
VVYAKPPFGGPHQVLKYLARYTHRVAISNQRLVAQYLMRPIARLLHFGLRFVKPEQVRDSHLSGGWLKVDKLISARLSRQWGPVGVVREYGVGVKILSVGAQKSALLGLIVRRKRGIEVSAPIPDGHGF